MVIKKFSEVYKFFVTETGGKRLKLGNIGVSGLKTANGG
jgi:hypothetical protein